jgi:hypothetical protein
MAIFDNIGGLLGDLGIGVPRNTGLISDTADIDAINKRALMSGGVNALLTYLATPKNLNAGSPLPYLGRAALSGFGASQNVIDQALNTAYRNKMLAGRDDNIRTIEQDRFKITQERQPDGSYKEIARSPLDAPVIAKPEGFTDTYKNVAFEMFGTANPSELTAQQRKDLGNEIKSREAAKRPVTNVNLPAPSKAILDVDKETLTGLTSSANSARSIANYTRNINSLIGDQQGSGVVKLGADVQNYLGIKSPTANVNQVVQAIATKGATEIRTPGSGSTSDLEFNAYRSAFPTLATSKEGRQLMIQIADANATRNAKLSDWARKNVQEGTFSYEGLAAYDNSLGQAVSDNVRKKVDELTGNVQTAPGKLSPEGQSVFDKYRPRN